MTNIVEKALELIKLWLQLVIARIIFIKMLQSNIVYEHLFTTFKIVLSHSPTELILLKLFKLTWTILSLAFVITIFTTLIVMDDDVLVYDLFPICYANMLL